MQGLIAAILIVVLLIFVVSSAVWDPTAADLNKACQSHRGTAQVLPWYATAQGDIVLCRDGEAVTP